jgi:hypothetical protein
MGLLQLAAVEPAVGQVRHFRGAGAAALALSVRPGIRLVAVELREKVVDLGQAGAGRKGRSQLASYRVALEVPGDVLADVAARPVLVAEEVDQQFRA